MNNISKAPPTILALDPSTEITGAAIIQRGMDGCIIRVEKWSFDATGAAKGTDLRARLDRIAATTGALSAWVSNLPITFDMVAYEKDTSRGFQASQALVMATGSYLLLPQFGGLKPVGMTRLAGCTAAECDDIYWIRTKGKPAKEIEAKREKLKAAVLAWANRHFDLELLPHQDAEADALAVAEAAFQKWLLEEKVKAEKAAQKAMFAKNVGKTTNAKKKVLVA